MWRAAVACVAVASSLASTSSTAAAQDHVTLRSDVLLYGDNTEFRNPFREGETIFGAAARVYADLALNDRVVMSLGVFGNQRFGSEDAFELVRPVIAMTVRGRRSAFTFGTLPSLPVAGPMGPDRGGPHALLPPLQRETLAFDRPYEAGLQWDFTGSRLTHSMWLDWQRLNTPGHRERFDAGLNGEFAIASHVSIPLQIHVVHEGGQLFDAGPVADSAAAAAGVNLHGDSGLLGRVALELFGAGAQSVPDRERPEENRTGIAFFGRASAERAGWRGHLIIWRGKRFMKDEGDPNYQSLRRNGRKYGGIRDYAEAGLARRFTLAPAAVLEISGRIHRTERFYEYSYRVLAIASPRWRLR
jgi:hypothetical protein